MLTKYFTVYCTIVFALGSTALATPQVLDPVAGGSTSATSTSSTGWIENSTDPHRALVEYDLAGFAGHIIDDASLSGSIWANNSLDLGQRDISVGLYSGNGVIQTSDYAVSTAYIGTVSYHPPSDGSVYFDLDVRTQLQQLLNGSATHAGVRFTPITTQSWSALKGPGLVPLDWPQLTIDSHPGMLIVGSCNAVLRDYNDDGTFTEMTVPGFGSNLSIRKFESASEGIPRDERSVIEFDVSSYADQQLASASLDFEIVGYAGS
jgi:hypothetical protein